MKKLGLSRLITLGITLLLILLLLLFFIFKNSAFIRSTAAPIGGETAHIDNALSSPFRWLSSTKRELVALFDTYEENESLKKELLKMKDKSLQVETLLKENESLSSALNTSDSFSNYKTVTGKVTVRSTLSWYESLTIGVGKKSGISKSMLAVSDGGLVGVVSDLSGSAAKVQLISNVKNTKTIPVKITTQTGDIYGVLTGYDSKNNLLIVEELNVDKQVSVGDTVVTSGLDGKSIAGVSVGKVSSVSEDKELSKRKVYISPTANLDTINYVTLIGK